jgi:micrococcal nuclease
MLRKNKTLKILILFFFLISFNEIANASLVIRVIDGDTFEIETGEKVRLIGINAPEISDIFGVESKEYLTKLIEGKDVDLQSDNLSSKTDRYNRLLRYVILNGEDINYKLILDGYAFAYLKYKFEKSMVYKDAQLIALSNEIGMWNKSASYSKPKESESIKEKSIYKIQKNEILLISIIVLLLIGILSYYKK